MGVNLMHEFDATPHDMAPEDETLTIILAKCRFEPRDDKPRVRGLGWCYEHGKICLQPFIVKCKCIPNDMPAMAKNVLGDCNSCGRPR